MKRYIVCSVACMVFSGTIFASAPQRVADSDYDWIDVATLDVGGRAALSEQEPFVRMVKSQRDVAPKSIQGMARESTGLSLRFRTTSRKLVFRYVTERRNWTDPLIPPSGLQSISVWRQTKGSEEWEYICKNHPNVDGDNEYATGWNPDSTGWLYFPMRSVVKTFSIGVEHGAKFETAGYPRPEKVVIYGTSIVHGGCVSSGGMMFTSFAGRRLGCEIINLGFSGGGKMELQMADLIAGIDASLYVVDCDWNMTVDLQKERYEPFVRRLRELRPSAPILLCGGCTEKKMPRDQEVFAKSVYEKLKAEDPSRWKNLHFLSGVDALPKCSWATHDHCHPNDYGAPFMGEFYARCIGEILGLDRNRVPDGK